uniref:Ubiquitin-like domain-containing protein n=1 Tax=Oryza glaberrima TaxID=4538 RepID=I1NQ13_ORYGL
RHDRWRLIVNLSVHPNDAEFKKMSDKTDVYNLRVITLNLNLLTESRYRPELDNPPNRRWSPTRTLGVAAVSELETNPNGQSLPLPPIKTTGPEPHNTTPVLRRSIQVSTQSQYAHSIEAKPRGFVVRRKSSTNQQPNPSSIDVRRDTKMQIVVETQMGKLITLEVESSDTICQGEGPGEGGHPDPAGPAAALLRPQVAGERLHGGWLQHPGRLDAEPLSPPPSRQHEHQGEASQRQGEEEGTPSRQIGQLIYKGVLVTDDKAAHEYNIEAGSVLHLTLNLRA